MKKRKSQLMQTVVPGAMLMAVLAVSGCAEKKPQFVVEPPVGGEVVRESKERPDMLDENSPAGLKVVQITTNPEIRSNNVYTEIQVFTPDSRKFVFYRQRNLWICDTQDDFSLRQITDERRIAAPSVTPDGKWMYYFVNTSTTSGGALTLKRASLEDFHRETIMVVDSMIPGTGFRPNGPATLSSISSDGKRLCIGAFLGDGQTVNAPFGILVYELEKPSVRLIFYDQGFHNAHPQYCRSLDPELSHDIMLQNNHGDSVLVNGRTVVGASGRGSDLHVIRDDGTNWRDIPVGRDSVGPSFQDPNQKFVGQHIQGHEQWLGRTGAGLSAMSYRSGPQEGYRPIFLAKPVPVDPANAHQGLYTPGGKYVDITRNIQDSDIWHFSSDLTGKYLVSDTYKPDEVTGKVLVRLVLGTLSDGDEPELKLIHLINTGASGRNPAHPHPFFSPDNRMVCFNSDESGGVQIYMLTNYTIPEV